MDDEVDAFCRRLLIGKIKKMPFYKRHAVVKDRMPRTIKELEKLIDRRIQLDRESIRHDN